MPTSLEKEHTHTDQMRPALPADTPTCDPSNKAFRRDDILYSFKLLHYTVAFLVFSFFIAPNTIIGMLRFDTSLLFYAALGIYYMFLVVYPFFRIKHLEIPHQGDTGGFPLLQCGDTVFIALFFIPGINLFWLFVTTLCVVEKINRLHAQVLETASPNLVITQKILLTAVTGVLLAALTPFLVYVMPRPASQTSFYSIIMEYSSFTWIAALCLAGAVHETIGLFLRYQERQSYQLVSFVIFVFAVPAFYVLYGAFAPVTSFKKISLGLPIFLFLDQMHRVGQKIQELFNRLGYGE